MESDKSNESSNASYDEHEWQELKLRLSTVIDNEELAEFDASSINDNLAYKAVEYLMKRSNDWTQERSVIVGPLARRIGKKIYDIVSESRDDPILAGPQNLSQSTPVQAKSHVVRLLNDIITSKIDVRKAEAETERLDAEEAKAAKKEAKKGRRKKH